MKKHRNGFLLKFAMCAFAVYIAASLISLAVHIKSSGAQLSTLKIQVTDVQKKNAQTERLLSENKNKYMETVAREDLGYAKPNERIYVDASGN